MVDESVVTQVRNYLRSVQDHGVAVRFGIIFGSQAAGQANRWSDDDSSAIIEIARREGQRIALA